MATPDILDFEKLLDYINTEEDPTGPELKDDSALSAVYYEVKDAREAARTSERQLQMAWGEAEEIDAIEPPDWKKVVNLATSILEEKSKDLWVAAWLTEGLTREHGIAGLRDGFRLCREMCHWFWDRIHPVPDEDGDETTVAQLTGLNGEDAEGALIAPINAIPITDEGTHRPFSSTDYLQSIDLDQVGDPESRAQRIEQGAVTKEMFETGLNESSPEFFKNLLEDFEKCLDEYRQLTEILEEKCSKDESGYSQAPPSSNIQRTLEECRDRIKEIARDKLAIFDEADEEQTDENGEVIGGGNGGSSGKLQTREDAFRQLLTVADYFRRAEPHSIVSYSLDQIVRWGRMPLPDLFKELIGDDTVRSEMFRRIGIQGDDYGNSGGETSEEGWSS